MAGSRHSKHQVVCDSLIRGKPAFDISHSDDDDDDDDDPKQWPEGSSGVEGSMNAS